MGLTSFVAGQQYTEADRIYVAPIEDEIETETEAGDEDDVCEDDAVEETNDGDDTGKGKEKAGIEVKEVIYISEDEDDGRAGKEGKSCNLDKKGKQKAVGSQKEDGAREYIYISD